MPFGGMPGGGNTFHFSTGGPGGAHHMSAEEANAFFSSFFGHDDPFGGLGGGRRRPGQPRVQSNIGGMPSMGGMGGGHPFGMFFDSMGGGMPGAGFRQQQAPPVKRYDAIPQGTVVSLKNLTSQPERNGDRGEIDSYDARAGRYVVVLEDSDEVLKVKPSNLLQHVHVTLQQLESYPELNGSRGTIIAWNSHKERYSIYVMDHSRAVSLKPSNVVLDNGTVGQIVNVTGKPELNGRYGTIRNYISETNRYDVQLSAEQIVRLKIENIRV
jgi:hypothetical protein